MQQEKKEENKSLKRHLCQKKSYIWYPKRSTMIFLCLFARDRRRVWMANIVDDPFLIRFDFSYRSL